MRAIVDIKAPGTKHLEKMVRTMTHKMELERNGGSKIDFNNYAQSQQDG